MFSLYEQLSIDHCTTRLLAEQRLQVLLHTSGSTNILAHTGPEQVQGLLLADNILSILRADIEYCQGSQVSYRPCKVH